MIDIQTTQSAVTALPRSALLKKHNINAISIVSSSVAAGGSAVQSLSYVAPNLTISGGNTVNIGTSTGYWGQTGSNVHYMTGNVGIGYTTPTSPLSFGTALGGKIALYDGGAVQYGIGIQSNLLQIYCSTGSADRVGIGYGTSAAFTETLSVLKSGNVGIGTTAPGANLQILGTTGLYVYDSTTQAVGTGGTIVLGGTFNDAGATTGSTSIKCVKESAVSGEYGFGLNFSTREHAASVTEKLRIAGNGDVGIGTTAPLKKLHTAVTDDVVYVSTGGGYATNTNTVVNNLSNVVNSASYLDITAGANFGSSTRLASINVGGSATTETDFAILVRQISGSTYNERLRINGETGWVGIGTTAPNGLLHVKNATGTGSVRLQVESTTSNAYVTIIGTSAGASVVDFGDEASTAQGRIIYNHTANEFRFYTQGVSRMYLNNGGDLSTPVFTSGFAGSGWQISGTNDATFDNLTVRKGMKVYELEISKIRSGNGSYWFSDGVKAQRVTDDVNYYYLWLDENNKPNMIPFAIDDIVRCQEWDFGTSTIRYYEGTTAYIDQTRSVIGIPKSNFIGDAPLAGDEVVRVGSTITASRRGAVYITSNDTESPYLDVVDGSSTVGGAFTTKARLGRLDGITDSDAGLSGSQTDYFGLYTDNAHLKGHIYSNSGTIAGWSLGTNAIASADNRIMMQKTQGFAIGKNALSSSNVLASDDRVNMYYTSSTSWGLIGLSGGVVSFRLGSRNEIAGFTFDGDNMYSDTLKFYGAEGDIEMIATGGQVPELFFKNGATTPLRIAGLNTNYALIESTLGLVIHETGANLLKIDSVGGIEIKTSKSADNIKLVTTSAQLSIGSLNASWCHYDTTATNGNYFYQSLTSTDFKLISDIHFKKNIKPYTDGLSKVLALKPSYFDWDETKEREGRARSGADLGMISQEVEIVEPMLVDTEEDGYKGLKYNKIAVLNTAAIQEMYYTQKEMNEALEAKIYKLEKLIDKLINK